VNQAAEKLPVWMLSRWLDGRRVAGGGWRMAKCTARTKRSGWFNVLCQPQAGAQKRNKHWPRLSNMSVVLHPHTHTHTHSNSHSHTHTRKGAETNAHVNSSCDYGLCSPDYGTMGLWDHGTPDAPVCGRPVPECLPQKQLNKLTRTNMQPQGKAHSKENSCYSYYYQYSNIYSEI